MHNILLYLFPIYCIFPGFQAENGVLMCNQKLIIDDREVQGLESWWMPVHEIALSRWRDLSNKIFLNLVMEVAHVPQSSTWPPIFFSLSSWRSWFKAGFIWPHIGYRVRTKKPLDLFKQVHFTILLVVYYMRGFHYVKLKNIFLFSISLAKTTSYLLGLRINFSSQIRFYIYKQNRTQTWVDIV